MASITGEPFIWEIRGVLRHNVVTDFRVKFGHTCQFDISIPLPLLRPN